MLGISIVKGNKYLILTLAYMYISFCCVKYGSCYCEAVVSGRNYVLPLDPHVAGCNPLHQWARQPLQVESWVVQCLKKFIVLYTNS